MVVYIKVHGLGVNEEGGSLQLHRQNRAAENSISLETKTKFSIEA